MASRFLLSAILLSISVLCPGLIGVSARQSDAITVILRPAPGQSVSGLVILQDAGDDTDVQVQIVAADPGTIAVIHRGTCQAFDPTPVALLGEPSSVGLVKTTISRSLTSLIERDHMVALHAGVTALETILACGEIPFVPEPPGLDPPAGTAFTVEPPEIDEPTTTPLIPEPPDPDRPTGTPDRSDPVDGRTYTSPTFAYMLTWDESWTVDMVETSDGRDHLTLLRPDDRLDLIGTSADEGDLASCLYQLSEALRDRDDVAQVDPFLDENGQPLQGEGEDSRWVAYTFFLTTDTRSTDLRVHYLHCLQLDAATILRVAQTTFLGLYHDEAAARDAVLATVRMPGQPPRSTPEPSATATLTVTVGPTDTPDTCAGVNAWIAVTKPRVDRALAIVMEVSGADFTTIEVALAKARDEFTALAEEQALVEAPVAVAELQQRFIALLLAEADLSQRQIDYLVNDPSNMSLLTELTQEARDNLAHLNLLSAELVELDARC